MKRVWVELEVFFESEPRVIRIFKSKSQAMVAWQNIRGSGIGIMDRGAAVSSVRHQIWLRCGGECELCASSVNESSGHMHERQHRGKGGEISLANSVFICPMCHRFAHRDRNTKFMRNHLTKDLNSGNL